MTEYDILEKIKQSYQTILGEKLTGIYIHGSLCFGCFCWEASDIDFLVVINSPLELAEKEALINCLLELDPYAPPKGLEMSVVRESVCSQFCYPTPFELHFSNFHKSGFRENISEYCQAMHGTDKDLAAHFTVIRYAGKVLCGKPISEVLGPVPKEAYLDSIRYDIENAEEDIVDAPVYYILNLCRVLAYLKDDQVLSKKQGGEWGIKRIPQYKHLIQTALDTYSGCPQFNAARTDLKSFAQYMISQMQSVN